jgi:two-component system, LuxR family, sensor kinase FixL
MNVLVANASAADRKRMADFLGPDRSVVSLDDGPADPRWPLAVVFLPESEEAGSLVAAVREKIGPSTVLIGMTDERDLDSDTLIAAGLDDICESVESFLSRYAFFTTRLMQRAQRHLRLEAILENTVDGIVVIDDRGMVQSINRAVEQIFGYPAGDVVGQNVSMLMPEPFAAEHDEYIERYLRTGAQKIIGIGREAVGRRANGDIFPLELAVSEIKIDGGSVFAGVIKDISERRHLENEILRVSEEERRRIGQDLHDGLGQMLTGIGLIAQKIGRTLRDARNEAADDVEEVVDLIREADQQARLLARGLVPVVVDKNGLGTALEELCVKAELLFGGHCTFEASGKARLDEAATAANVYRIAQEAVSNAFKHGRSDEVKVTLISGKDSVRLRVTDNGIGFPEVLAEDRGMGVRIMHYRASVVGGQLQIRRLAEGGTLVSCDIPRRATPRQA